MFSMLLAARLMEFKHELDNDHWRFFLTGGISLDDHLPPIPENAAWLSAKSWAEIVRLSSLYKFDDFYKHFYTPDILVSDVLSRGKVAEGVCIIRASSRRSSTAAILRRIVCLDRWKA